MSKHRTTVRLEKDRVNEIKIKMLRKYKDENMTKLFRILLDKYLEEEIKISEGEWISYDK
jgi:hypothetical protein